MADSSATNGIILHDSDKVKVAIRVRPFNRREIDLKTKCVVEVKGDQTILHHVPVPTTVTGGSVLTPSTKKDSKDGSLSSTPKDNSNNSQANGTNPNGSLTRPPKLPNDWLF